MTQYFSDVFHQPTFALDVPDLQALAKDHNVTAALVMCRFTITIAVQCERNKDVIDKIQRLSESEQHSLMKAIEQVSSFFVPIMSMIVITTLQVMAKVKASSAHASETSMAG